MNNQFSKSIALALFLVLTSISSIAQVNHFLGLSAGVDLIFTSATSEFSNNVGISQSLTSIGENSANGNIKVAYGFAMGGNSFGNRGVFSVGGSYGVDDIKSGSVSNTSTASFKQKNVFSLYLEPGLLASNTTLIYGKLALQSMDFQSTFNSCSKSGNDPWVCSSLATYNQSLKGYGYGVGIRTVIARNIFLQVEAMQTSYDKGVLLGAIDVKSTVSSGGVGVGFKF